LSRVKAILEGPEAPNTGAAFDRARGLQNLFASAGIDTKDATDMNGLVKNLARYEASRATAAGLGGTDAARELSHNGQPNVSIDSRALRGIVDQSLATEKAIAAYAGKQAQTQDPAKLQSNEAEFRNIPNLIEGYQYGMSRNPQEAEQFLKDHGLSRSQMSETRKRIKQFEGQWATSTPMLTCRRIRANLRLSTLMLISLSQLKPLRQPRQPQPKKALPDLDTLGSLIFKGSVIFSLSLER
jgi:hypothetical protein